jgi:galactokinase
MARALESDRFDAVRNALAATPGSVPGPVRFARAPGRVNLIGDHTDYQEGLCLPIAINRDVLIGFRPRADGRVHVRSLDLDAEAALPAPEVPPWARPIAETVALISTRSAAISTRSAAISTRSAGPFPGFDAAITSTVPIGSGLSSSAAFAVALGIVTARVGGVALAPTDLALLAQEVEQRATGVPCGVMDQLASVGGLADCALLLDCRTLEVTPVPIPAAVGILVVHSGLERRLATSAYAERRSACEDAARRVGVPTLRDANIEQVADDPIARHVVTENARVAAFAAAFAHNDIATAGELMLASHRSLRDDFEVSTPELDLLVDLSVDAGAYGARLTGAGFGGCIVALVNRETLDEVAAAVTDRYRSETGRVPNAFAVTAVGGAGLVETK